METLTVAEFNRLCLSLGLKSFEFDSANQDGIISDINLVARYTGIVFMPCPDRICLTSSCGNMCFERVKCVRYNSNLSESCYVFDIICGHPCDYTLDVTYRITSDRKLDTND